MYSTYKEQFMDTMMRMKKTALCFIPDDSFQYSEFLVMCRISTGCEMVAGGYTVSEIQQSLHISKPAVSQTLNSLEKKGFIIRSIDTADRRKITVMLTENGQAELKMAKCCHDTVLDKVLADFGHDNLKMFIELTNRLLDTLER